MTSAGHVFGQAQWSRLNSTTNASRPTLTDDRSGPLTMAKVMENPVYAKRRQQFQGVCKQLTDEKVAMWTRYKNIAYCILPKVGCTFWKSVFRFLVGDTGGNYSSPFQIPRIFVHTNNNHMAFRIYRDSGRQYLRDEFRFMFVREPYSRLFSAYVDKLLLPDFWGVLGRPIAKLRANKSNAKCGHDISFKEFVDFVVTRRPAKFDNHWKPVHTLCSPCLFQPHIIGKMDTFSQDTRYVLRLLNSSWMLDSYSHDQHVLQEIDMLIDYNFAIMPRVRGCASPLEVSRRLWTAFQINGYLPPQRGFPEQRTGNINKQQFRTLVHQTYREAPKTSAETRQQRKQMIIDAYRVISNETLYKLKNIYRYDFLMFDYNPEPKYLFKHRK